MYQPPQEPLYQTNYLGASTKIYPEYVEYSVLGTNLQRIPIGQIASVLPATLGVWQITLVTISGQKHAIPTHKKKEVERAILDARARLVVVNPPPPVPAYQQPNYPVQQPYQPVQPTQAETTVKTYGTSKEFQHDQKRMARQGWTVQSTTSHQPRRSIGGLLFVPFAMYRPPKSQILVTYQRTR